MDFSDALRLAAATFVFGFLLWAFLAICHLVPYPPAWGGIPTGAFMVWIGLGKPRGAAE